MIDAARRVLDDGPADADWDAAWLAELDRRCRAAETRKEPAPKWADVRAELRDDLRR